MTYIMVDVEADGEIPSRNSMISFGAVVVEPSLDRTFFGQCKPISTRFNPEALRICKVTREEIAKYPDPKETMEQFYDWVQENGGNRPLFISDNNGYDFQWINWYFHYFLGKNPFGYTSTNLGSLYKGLVKSVFMNFKHLRKTKHTHHPVDDAMGNAEAMLYMVDTMGLQVGLE